MEDEQIWSERLAGGGEESLDQVFQHYRPRLETMIRFRISPALSSRMDVQDVLQEAFLVIRERVTEYQQRHVVSAFVWMRQLTLQKLVDLQRYHFGQKRDPNREFRPDDASAVYSISRSLVSTDTSPTGVARRNEELERLRVALDEINPTDQEVVALRHFEQLSNRETAQALGISEKAASNRYVRALAQLKKLLSALSE